MPRLKSQRVQDATGGFTPSDLPLAPNYRYVYVHYPKGWTFCDEVGWIPELSKLVGRPGANGVTLQNGRPDMSRAIASARSVKNGIVILPDDSRLGDEYEGPEGAGFCHYLHTMPTRHRTKDGEAVPYYLDAWMDPEVFGDEVHWRDVTPEWNRFRVHLRDQSGMIPPMQEGIYLRRVAMLQEELKLMRPHPTAYPPEEIQAVEKRLKAMAASWKKLSARWYPEQTERRAAPKRKRAPKEQEGAGAGAGS